MVGYIIAFAGGLIAGSFFGIITAAMCVAASDADRNIERWEETDGQHH